MTKSLPIGSLVMLFTIVVPNMGFFDSEELEK